MQVAHHRLGFPQQLRDLSGVPVVSGPFVALLGMWVPHVFCLAQVLSAERCFHDVSDIPYETFVGSFLRDTRLRLILWPPTSTTYDLGKACFCTTIAALHSFDPGSGFTLT